MYLVDYHTHTCCSPDSTAPLSDMVRAARRAGLKELCTTDHCDLQQEGGEPLASWDWTSILNQYNAVRREAAQTGFHLLLGLELGGAQTDPRRAGEILDGAPLDFVIGSIHNLSPAAGGVDFFFLNYTAEADVRSALDDYVQSLLDLSRLPFYDALGHIIYPLRYINGRGGRRLTLDPWRDQLDQVLRTVMETGRAIEVNTHCGREVEDWRPILKRYRDLGGELVTLGSDAHRPDHVGRGLARAVRLLEQTGFRYLTVYRRRRPEQIKL